MRFEINVVFGVLLLLTGASQSGGLSDLPPAATSPSPTRTSESPDWTEDPKNETPQWTHNPTFSTEPSEEITTETLLYEHTVQKEIETNSALPTDLIITSSATPTNVPVATDSHSDSASSSAAADDLSSTPTGPLSTPLEHGWTTDSSAHLTSISLATFSSPPAHTVQDGRSTAPASTPQLEDESLTTKQTSARPQTAAPGEGPAGPAHQDVPSELNVGDEELKRARHHSKSPLDPLLAGLLTVFIVTTAIVFVALFLKFRQRTNHPEFHRLQDLPMDDLMEDTPLSRYSY